MVVTNRTEIYTAQNSGGALTPRQQRRIKHKDGRDRHRAEKRRFLRDLVVAAGLKSKGNKG